MDGIKGVAQKKHLNKINMVGKDKHGPNYKRKTRVLYSRP